MHKYDPSASWAPCSHWVRTPSSRLPQKIVLIVEGKSPPAALVRCLTPGVHVLQTDDPGALARGRDRVLDGTAHEHAKGLSFVASVPADVLHGSVDDARRHAAASLG